jgi:hypothetical protein
MRHTANSLYFEALPQRPKLATIMKSASGGDLSRPWQLSGYPPKRHLHDRARGCAYAYAARSS